jgi:hypothetical protein
MPIRVGRVIPLKLPINTPSINVMTNTQSIGFEIVVKASFPTTRYIASPIANATIDMMLETIITDFFLLWSTMLPNQNPDAAEPTSHKPEIIEVANTDFVCR